MTKDEAKLAYGLISLYCVLFKGIYNKQPVVNKYREKWAMQEVIDSIGYDRSKQLLEYYFKTNRVGHPLSWFFYNFEKLDLSLQAKEQDLTRRELLRSRTKTMVEERDNEH